MSEEKAVMQQFPAPLGWGDRAEVKEVADRLRRFLPGTKTMNDEEIMAYAQYVVLTGLNPFREVYGWDSKGDGSGSLVTKEHYALIVRWAKSQESFTVRYWPIEAGQNDTAYRCRLLRDSGRILLQQLLASGVAYQEALEWATTEGLGIISAREKAKKSPPKGKDWDWVARKRALEDAIREAFGMPTTQELAQQSWIVEGVATIAGDWNGVTMDMIPTEREATARYNARRRECLPLSKSAAESIVELFGDGETGEIVSEETGEIAGRVPDMPPEAIAEPELAEPESESPPELPETLQETPGQPSPWQNRGNLIFKTKNEIGYYDNAPHIIGALKKLEAQGQIVWDMDDETLFKKLNAYAKMRADEKAAEGGSE